MVSLCSLPDSSLRFSIRWRTKATADGSCVNRAAIGVLPGQPSDGCFLVLHQPKQPEEDLSLCGQTRLLSWQARSLSWQARPDSTNKSSSTTSASLSQGSSLIYGVKELTDSQEYWWLAETLVLSTSHFLQTARSTGVWQRP